MLRQISMFYVPKQIDFIINKNYQYFHSYLNKNKLNIECVGTLSIKVIYSSNKDNKHD